MEQLKPEHILSIAIQEAYEALDEFKVTGDRTVFKEWRKKWKRVVEMLKDVENLPVIRDNLEEPKVN